ncbi:MAG: sulfotransferase family 2 domain-containing protein [Nitrosomonadaceae bacterium]
MVVNDTEKYIFIHVGKNGGCSVESVLGGRTTPTGAPDASGTSMHLNLTEIPNREDYFSFAFIRNPWDRAVSSFMYVRSHQRSDGKTRNKETFAQMVNELVPGVKKTAQYDMVKNCSFVGRFEHFQEDFDTACDLIGIEQRPLPKLNSNKKAHYTEFYTPELIEKIYDFTSYDVDHFGFTFEGTATKNIGDMR